MMTFSIYAKYIFSASFFLLITYYATDPERMS